MRNNINSVPRKKRKNPETIVQIGIFDHLTPRMRAEKYSKFLAIHVPNGEKRDIVTAKILKSMGVMAGVADILLFFAGGKTVFVELKLKSIVEAKRGPDKGKMVERTTKQLDTQIWFMNTIRKLGFKYYLVEATDISDGLNQLLDIIERESDG